MFTCKCVYCFSHIKKEELLFRVADLMERLKPKPQPTPEPEAPEEKETDTWFNENEGATASFLKKNVMIDEGEEGEEGEEYDENSPLNSPMGGQASAASRPYGGGTEESMDSDALIDLKDALEQKKAVYEMESNVQTQQVKEVLKIYDLEWSGQSYEGKIYVSEINRYCPVCGEKVISSIGRCPIITIGLIGHQAAGKTVYLTIQDYFLRKYSAMEDDDQDMMVPAAQRDDRRRELTVPGGRLYFSREDSYLGITEEGQAEVEIISDASKNFNNDARFPDSTGFIPPPYCIRVGYRRKGENVECSECVVCYRDIMGEVYTTSRPEDFEKARLFLQRADAFLVLTDPTVFSLGEAYGHCRDFDKNLSEGLQEKISKIFEGVQGVINKPCVLMVTKQDEIEDYIKNHIGKLSGFSMADPIVAPGFSMAFSKDSNFAAAFRELSESTRKCFKTFTYGSSWYALLDKHFDIRTMPFIPITAIGDECTVYEHHLAAKDDKGELIRLRESQYDEWKREQEQKKKEQAQNGSHDGETGHAPNQPEFEFVPPSAYIDRAIEKIKHRFLFLPLLYLLDFFSVIPPMFRPESYETVDVTQKCWFFFERVVGSHDTFRDDYLNTWYEFVSKNKE